MGDAAEVLTALYEKLAAVAAKAGQPSMLDDNFGLHVRVGIRDMTHYDLQHACLAART